MREIVGVPILEIPVGYIKYVPQLQDIILERDINQADALVFTKKKVGAIPEEALKNLWGYRCADLYRGYLWEIEEDPETIGFTFYQERQSCLYVSNVPYLLLHHSPTGYAWGYSGSGSSDLALNLAEYFARKHYQNLTQTELWKKQKASLLAYCTHYDIRDLVNAMLAQKQENPAHIPFDTLATAILEILDTNYSTNLDYFQDYSQEDT